MSPRSMRLSTCGIAMLLKPLPPREPKKTKSLPFSVGSARSSAMARLGERDLVLLAALHAASRYRPRLVPEGDLGPLRADHLAGACGGEDGEFQRPCGHAFALSQLGHEGRQARGRAAPHGGRPWPLVRALAAPRLSGFSSVPDCRPCDSRAPWPNPTRLRSGRAPGSWFRFWSTNAARSRAALPGCRCRPPPCCRAPDRRRPSTWREIVAGAWRSSTCLRAGRSSASAASRKVSSLALAAANLAFSALR